VTPIERPRPRFVVMIFPRMMMSTPAVYRRFDEMHLGSAGNVERPVDWKQWAKLGAEELLPLLVNDLEAPAFSLSPQLAMLRDKIESKLGRIIRMSGSGSTLFTLMDERQEADEAAAAVRELSVDAIAVELAPGQQIV
jgi:4-diphosphocytidyl-2-C-methyl-D-erythritol kinase